jgi:hypothetical protein
VNVDDDLFTRPVDHDLRNSGVKEFLLDELANLYVFVELHAVAALREPIRLPPI